MKKCFLLISLFCSLYALGQEKKKPGPDGTMGEVFEADTATSKRKLAHWNQFDGPVTTLKIAGGFLIDMAAYIQDDNAKRQLDSSGKEMEHFNLRDFRLQLSGRLKLKIKREITWRAALMYDGNLDAWLVRETGLMIQMPELSGHLWVGRSKEGLSMEKTMNGYSVWGMERQPGIDLIPIMADGIKWIGHWKQPRIFWTAGAFINWISKNQGFSTFRWQTNLRVGWLPIYKEAPYTVLHVAGYYRYGVPEDHSFKVTGKPEASTAPFFVETPKFNCDHTNTFGGEIYFSRKSLMMGSEFYVHRFNTPDHPEASDPVFKTGDVSITYLLTGEERPYTTVGDIYGFAPVKKPVFRGGPGAWELVLRASYFDANDSHLHGGLFWKVMPTMIWHLSKNVRIGMAYGYGELDRFEIKGATHFFQWRVHLQL